ncbi:hypothetical protein DQ04_12541000 [Trypanosoma grayi]|uniref:hypothetical protein n=1 Tax=Trypanosoma grayi TaxID=71804 RepID=UPI0004F40ECA|nr:hypothetical protein DQ04_12541000 [Trypanosoma grayi]KEG06727.1 hypothetical protein DQ04_12541000 [Trypanosoma grayi]
MFDSVKAHSDTEVEGNGRTLSTRGAARTVPLPLRSLCKPQTAVWLVRHAAVLLELMSPGLWKRHLKLRVLADGVATISTDAGCSDGAETSPARSVATTVTVSGSSYAQHVRSEHTGQRSTTPQRSQRQLCPKLSMEEISTQPKRSRPISWSAPVSRAQSSHLASSSSKRRPTASNKRCIPPSSNSVTPRGQRRDDVVEDECGGPCPLPPIPSPAPHSSGSTPTKGIYSSSATRPYLGFRVAVGRDDAGHTTLTVHEVTESYVGSNSDVAQVGPAFAAGLRAGDQLIRFAGYAVTELASFNAVVARHVRPSGSVPVVISRDGELMSATIVVGEKSRSVGL